MTFNTLFWSGIVLDNVEEQDALKVLINNDGEKQKVQNAFEILLRSATTPAQCVAIDYYCLLQRDERWGRGNKFRELKEFVENRIDYQLAQDAYVRNDSEKKLAVGANHASSFYAISLLSYKCDSILFTNALIGNTDPYVIELACMAADVILLDEEKPYLPLVELLVNFAKRKDISEDVSMYAVKAISAVDTEEFDGFLIDMTNDERIRVASTAARWLGEKNFTKHKDLLFSLSEKWPETDTYYEVYELRLLLNDHQ